MNTSSIEILILRTIELVTEGVPIKLPVVMWAQSPSTSEMWQQSNEKALSTYNCNMQIPIYGVEV